MAHALISIIAIPLSLVTAALVLYLPGATFNMITLTGFIAAISVVVYDAIIDVENIMRRIQNRTDRSIKATARLIVDASHEARSASSMRRSSCCWPSPRFTSWVERRRIFPPLAYLVRFGNHRLDGRHAYGRAGALPDVPVRK